MDSSRPSTSHSHAIPDDVGVSKVSDDPDTTGVVCDSEAATASATLQAQMENIIKQSMAVQPTLFQNLSSGGRQFFLTCASQDMRKGTNAHPQDKSGIPASLPPPHLNIFSSLRSRGQT